jgi:hypothetical protein
LALVEQCQIVEAGSGVGVVRPQRFLLDGEGALVQRFGFPVAALVAIDLR